MTFVGSLALPIAILYPRTRNAMLAVLAFVGCARIAVSRALGFGRVRRASR